MDVCGTGSPSQQRSSSNILQRVNYTISPAASASAAASFSSFSSGLNNYKIERGSPSKKCYRCRLETFETATTSISPQGFEGLFPSRISKESLAEAGFFWLRDRDLTQCGFCSVVIGDWEDGDDPFLEHARHSPNCPFVLKSTNNDSHLDCPVPKFKKSFSERLSSFPSFSHPNQNPELLYLHSSTTMKLSKLAFFYFWNSGELICHHCGFCVSYWTREENLIEKHALYSSSCWLNELKRRQVWRATVEHLKRQRRETQQKQRQQQQQQQQQQQTSRPIAAVAGAILEEEPPATLLFCQVCLEQAEKLQVFLPCAHQISCDSCAAKFQDCPMCRKKIEKRLTTFFC